MKKTTTVLAALVLALCLSGGDLFAASLGNLDVRPNLVTIGTNYNGADLTVTGAVPEGSSVVVRMLGEREDKTFKQKGKAFGLLWMNLSSITLHNVPGVFLLALDPDVYSRGGRSWQGLDLGFQSFEGSTDKIVYDEFVKLKEREGLYGIQEGGIAYGPAKDGARPFSVDLVVPSSLRKGVYEVEAFAVKDGRVLGQARREVHAELAGFPALLSSVAFHHSLIYGIAAVVIAIMAGLAMTVVFKDRGGAH